MMQQRSELLKIFSAQRAILIRYAEKFIRNHADAEDIVQEAWLRFSKQEAAFQANEPAAYLHRIVRNLALDRLRRKGLEMRLVLGEALETASIVTGGGSDLEAVTIARNDLRLVEQTLQTMPERMRIAVEMHRIDGAKLKDIAVRLSVSVTTAHELVVAGIERCRAAVRTGRS